MAVVEFKQTDNAKNLKNINDALHLRGKVEGSIGAGIGQIGGDLHQGALQKNANAIINSGGSNEQIVKALHNLGSSTGQDVSKQLGIQSGIHKSGLQAAEESRKDVLQSRQDTNFDRSEVAYQKGQDLNTFAQSLSPELSLRDRRTLFSEYGLKNSVDVSGQIGGIDNQINANARDLQVSNDKDMRSYYDSLNANSELSPNQILNSMYEKGSSLGLNEGQVAPYVERLAGEVTKSKALTYSQEENKKRAQATINAGAERQKANNERAFTDYHKGLYLRNPDGTSTGKRYEHANAQQVLGYATRDSEGRVIPTSAKDVSEVMSRLSLPDDKGGSDIPTEKTAKVVSLFKDSGVELTGNQLEHFANSNIDADWLMRGDFSDSEGVEGKVKAAAAEIIAMQETYDHVMEVKEKSDRQFQVARIDADDSVSNYGRLMVNNNYKGIRNPDTPPVQFGGFNGYPGFNSLIPKTPVTADPASEAGKENTRRLNEIINKRANESRKNTPESNLQKALSDRRTDRLIP